MDEQPVFLDLMSDIGFKKIFSNEKILIRFLNVILKRKKKIRKIKYLDKESITAASDKMMIFDIYCEASDGSSFIIEMQRRSEVNYISRSLFYMSQSIAGQVKKEDDWHYDLKPVYGIFFVNFHLERYQKPKRTVKVITLKDEDNDLLTDLVKMFFVDLRSFNKEADECKTNIDRFLYVFKHIKDLKTMPFITQDEVFATIADVAAYSKLTEKERWAYDESLKHARDWNNSLYWSRQEGREEGREEERAKAHQEKLLAAYNLFKTGALSLDQIAKAMSLNERELSDYVIDKETNKL